MTPAEALDQHLRAAIREFGSPTGTGGRDMSKLSAVADRIATLKKRLDDKADALSKRLDATDKLEGDAFQRASTFLNIQDAEVDEIDRTIRQLSNLPLDGSSKSPTD